MNRMRIAALVVTLPAVSSTACRYHPLPPVSRGHLRLVHSGIVLDGSSGLRWTAREMASNASASQARDAAETVTVGGLTNWRLPTVSELLRIANCDGPGIDPPQAARHWGCAFFEVRGSRFWAHSTRHGGLVVLDFGAAMPPGRDPATLDLRSEAAAGVLLVRDSH